MPDTAGVRELLARTDVARRSHRRRTGDASLLTAGATFGYALLWVVVLSATLGAVPQ